MRTHSPLFLLAALGVLSCSGAAFAAPDTSDWKCESCPYPKGGNGAVEVGLGAVSDPSSKFGDWTGLNRDKAFLVLDGEASYRSESGYYADVVAANLGLASRSLKAQSGREGVYNVRLGYSETPRYFSEGAATPYLGSGSTVLTLPAGFPAASTATMPLASTLQPLDLDLRHKRFDLSGSWIGGTNWSWRVSLRRDTREGVKPGSAAFFASAMQLAIPMDQTTDVLEISASYVDARMQGRLAYQISQFRNDTDTLTFASPYWPVVTGATRGQLALAPDNQFHQFLGSGGWQISPAMRLSGDFAVGRLTQNEAYVPATLTASLAGRATVPAASLDGRVDTFNGSLRFTAATPIDGLRLNASAARDVRDNRTGVASYPLLATDIFLDSARRANTPFSFWQDRLKVSADYRGPNNLKFSAGADQDNRERSYSEAVTTKETTVWARMSVQAHEKLALAMKISQADRSNNGYGTANWFGSPENTLMRKYGIASRKRDAASVRADVAVTEQLAIGLTLEGSKDDYDDSLIGLSQGRTSTVTADASFALSDNTSITGFVQTDRVRSLQNGSQSYAAPDWTARQKDRFEVAGIGIKHAAIPDKLDIGADLAFTRSHSDVNVVTVLEDSAFPSARTSMDSVKLWASYKLSDAVTLNGSWWYEKFDSRDWRLDGLLPATVGNLLAFGQQAPAYKVNVVKVSVRYRF